MKNKKVKYLRDTRRQIITQYKKRQIQEERLTIAQCKKKENLQTSRRKHNSRKDKNR